MEDQSKQKIIQAIKDGLIFIYPTDTIYGIGCNAHNNESVNKIKEMKSRDKDKPLSIIAPSKQWIKENLIAEDELLDKYLPGTYTLILKKKDKNFLSNASASETLGIRIPDHEFTHLIKEAQVPFITTSVNLSGEKFATKVEDIKQEILDNADIVVNNGELSGKPSTIILENGEELQR